MPGRWRWVVAAVCGLVAAPASAPASDLSELRDPAAGARITTLENGLTVLLVEDHSTPVVSSQVWVKAGSRDETRFTGIAHLFEHMMFKGTKHLGPQQFTQLVESRGGRLNAFTSEDMTVYFEDVAPESLPLVIDLEAERFANLEVTQSLLDSEREVVLEERRMRNEDDPRGRSFEALLALAFQAHPYRWPVIGWRSDVEAVTVEACRDFFETYYAPNNLVVAVAGDLDVETTLDRITRRFGGLEPAREIPRTPTREPEPRGARRAAVDFDVRGAVLAVAWHAPPAGHEDSAALDMLSEILSGGRSARLYRRLVEDEQVALGANAQYWEMLDAGLVVGVVRVRPDASIERAEALYFEEVERIRSRPVAPAELERARRQLEVGLVEGLTTAHSLASRVGNDWTMFGRIRPLSELLGRIEAVTVEDVQRVAQTYLAPERRSTVRVARPEAAAATTPPVRKEAR